MNHSFCFANTKLNDLTIENSDKYRISRMILVILPSGIRKKL